MSLSFCPRRAPRGLPARLLLPPLLMLVASFAHAQGAPARPDRPDPLDPQARVPSVTHGSSFAGYRRLGEDIRTSWKEANETVNRIGGWRAYARETQAAPPVAPTTPRTAPATVPMPVQAPATGPASAPRTSGHGGHGGHGAHKTH